MFIKFILFEDIDKTLHKNIFIKKKKSKKLLIIIIDFLKSMVFFIC